MAITKRLRFEGFRRLSYSDIPFDLLACHVDHREPFLTEARWVA